MWLINLFVRTHLVFAPKSLNAAWRPGPYHRSIWSRVYHFFFSTIDCRLFGLDAQIWLLINSHTYFLILRIFESVRFSGQIQHQQRPIPFCAENVAGEFPKWFSSVYLSPFRSQVLEEDDQTRGFKRLIWNSSPHEISPEVIWYHETLGWPLKAWAPRELLEEVFSAGLYAVCLLVGVLLEILISSISRVAELVAVLLNCCKDIKWALHLLAKNASLSINQHLYITHGYCSCKAEP